MSRKVSHKRSRKVSRKRSRKVSRKRSRKVSRKRSHKVSRKRSHKVSRKRKGDGYRATYNSIQPGMLDQYRGLVDSITSKYPFLRNIAVNLLNHHMETNGVTPNDYNEIVKFIKPLTKQGDVSLVPESAVRYIDPNYSPSFKPVNIDPLTILSNRAS